MNTNGLHVTSLSHQNIARDAEEVLRDTKEVLRDAKEVLRDAKKFAHFIPWILTINTSELVKTQHIHCIKLCFSVYFREQRYPKVFLTNFPILVALTSCPSFLESCYFSLFWVQKVRRPVLEKKNFRCIVKLHIISRGLDIARIHGTIEMALNYVSNRFLTRKRKNFKIHTSTSIDEFEPQN